MSNYKCKCGNTSDFFIEHNLSQCGMYCSWCGKWIKWLNKDEERLFKHKQSNAEHDAKVKEEIIEDVITYVLNAYKYDSLTKEQLKNILNEAKEVCR